MNSKAERLAGASRALAVGTRAAGLAPLLAALALAGGCQVRNDQERSHDACEGLVGVYERVGSGVGPSDLYFLLSNVKTGKTSFYYLHTGGLRSDLSEIYGHHVALACVGEGHRQLRVTAYSAQAQAQAPKTVDLPVDGHALRCEPRGLVLFTSHYRGGPDAKAANMEGVFSRDADGSLLLKGGRKAMWDSPLPPVPGADMAVRWRPWAGGAAAPAP